MKCNGEISKGNLSLSLQLGNCINTNIKKETGKAPILRNIVTCYKSVCGILEYIFSETDLCKLGVVEKSKIYQM